MCQTYMFPVRYVRIWMLPNEIVFCCFSGGLVSLHLCGRGGLTPLQRLFKAKGGGGRSLRPARQSFLVKNQKLWLSESGGPPPLLPQKKSLWSCPHAEQMSSHMFLEHRAISRLSMAPAAPHNSAWLFLEKKNPKKQSTEGLFFSKRLLRLLLIFLIFNLWIDARDI